MESDKRQDWHDFDDLSETIYSNSFLLHEVPKKYWIIEHLVVLGTNFDMKPHVCSHWLTVNTRQEMMADYRLFSNQCESWFVWSFKLVWWKFAQGALEMLNFALLW